MAKLNIGDRVKATETSGMNCYKKGDTGTITGICHEGSHRIDWDKGTTGYCSYLELITSPNEPIYASTLMDLIRKNPEAYEGKRYKVTTGAMTNRLGKEIDQCEIKKGIFSKNGFRGYFSDTTKLQEILPEPKPEPVQVDIKEAMKARGNDMPIFVRCGGYNRIYHQSLSDGNLKDSRGHHGTSTEIIDGIWYIGTPPDKNNG